jgi:hypothetical protein
MQIGLWRTRTVGVRLVCARFKKPCCTYARLLHSWTDNMRVINAPWDFDLAKVRSAVGGGAAENTRTRRMQRGRAAQRTRGVPSTRAVYVAWHTCCTPHNVRMPYTFFSTSPERIWTPRAALVCASLQVASLRGPGRVVVTTAPDDTTNPPPMQKCAHECRHIAVYVVLVADVGLCRWVADHIPGAELLVQQPGWGHAHCFIAEVG